jgi:hypothetical protein
VRGEEDGEKREKGEIMDFLVSHWHCIVPLAAIVIVMLLRGRGRDGDRDKRS